MTTKEILQKLHKFFLTHGWGQQAFTCALPGPGESRKMCFCIMGGMIKVTGAERAGDIVASPPHLQACELILDTIETYRLNRSDPWGALTIWNDSPERTRREILHALRQAIRRA